MKKIIISLLCALIVFAGVSVAACKKNTESIKVYAPDGAPALALAQMITGNSKLGQTTEYHIADPSAIQGFVTGKQEADICILPVNLASKLLGTGENYKLLGTVTNGNLFLLKKAQNADITRENISALVGKTVGVVNLAAVPGLTFELILKDCGVEYNILTGGNSAAADKVNLLAVNAGDVVPASSCDYFVVPEPAASVKVARTSLEWAGSLQTLYGGGGFPQAVAVAKTGLIEKQSGYISEFTAALQANAEWLKSSEISGYLRDIVGAINSKMLNSAKSSLNAENLTAQVILNCAIGFTPAAECKEKVNEFLDKLIAVNPQSAKKVQDSFYYVK